MKALLAIPLAIGALLIFGMSYVLARLHGDKGIREWLFAACPPYSEWNTMSESERRRTWRKH